MPPIKFSHVVSFSSEDIPLHRADNLVSGASGAGAATKKWRCAGEGEASAHVVLRLERACAIESVDVGNFGSAFVEVQVGRGGGEEDGAFSTLLAASSFMSPMESRNGQNAARVRMFATDKLNRDVAAQKWDRVKVVCTQPFNKRVK